jgi:hypothetical protein
MMVVDATIVNVALPSIQRDLDFSQADLMGRERLHDRLRQLPADVRRLGPGRPQKVFLIGLSLFTAASALCGVADDRVMLIASASRRGSAARSSLGGPRPDRHQFPNPRERVTAMTHVHLDGRRLARPARRPRSRSRSTGTGSSSSTSRSA